MVNIESHIRKEPIICERDTLYICTFLPRTIEMPWHANTSLFISLARESEKVGELCLLLERGSKKKTSLSLSINQIVFGRWKRSSISLDRLWKQPKCRNQSHVSFPTQEPSFIHAHRWNKVDCFCSFLANHLKGGQIFRLVKVV